MKGIIGKKMGMTQIFDEDGQVVPVTVIQAAVLCNTGWTEEKTDIPLSAWLRGTAAKRMVRRTNRPGTPKAQSDLPDLRYLREFRTKSGCRRGAASDGGCLRKGDRSTWWDIKAARRHNQAPQLQPPEDARDPTASAPGSSATSTVALKGTRMAGAWVNRVTVQNLEVVVDADRICSPCVARRQQGRHSADQESRKNRR